MTVVVRGDTLAQTMSRYLRDALAATDNIDVRPRTEVVGGGADSDGWLDRLVLRGAGGATEEVEAGGLFILIGGRPHTDWLPESVERDNGGYVLTGTDLIEEGRVAAGWPLDRTPLMLETSTPRVFAVGDARHGSIQRLASAVGEGSVVVAQLHQLLASPERAPEPSPH